MHKIELLLNALNKVKQTGKDQWLACCPVHDDKNPSMSISVKDGKVLCHCHSCGANGSDAVQAVGLSTAEVFYGAEPWEFTDTAEREKYAAKHENHKIWKAKNYLEIAQAHLNQGLPITPQEKEKIERYRRYLISVNMLNCQLGGVDKRL